MVSTRTPDALLRYGLLRHGKTVWNEQKRIQGRGDSPLTRDGIHTVERWGRQLQTSPDLDWRVIIHSPQKRARDTAEILANILEVGTKPVEGLREQNWGKWEGLTLEEISRDFGEELDEQIKRGWEFRPPDGESRREVLHRTRTCLVDFGETASPGNVLVISHQGVIKALLYDLLNHDYLPAKSAAIHKNRLHHIEYAAGRLFIEKLDIALDSSL